MGVPSSFPLNIISLSFPSDLIIKSELALLNLPNATLLSFNNISEPFASNVISPSTSSRKSVILSTSVVIIFPFTERLSSLKELETPPLKCLITGVISSSSLFIISSSLVLSYDITDSPLLRLKPLFKLT